MLSKVQTIFVIVVTFLSFNANGSRGGYFENLRADLLVPEHCRQTSPTHFKKADQMRYFTVSIEGGARRGFDYEYPARRDQMTVLYKVFHNELHGSDWFRNEVRSDHNLANQYNRMRQLQQPMGFDFSNEGEVLEILAIDWMQQKLDPNYFVTGSVAYSSSAGHNTVGELDLIIADKATCQVISVGEAKLGIRSLGKARRQLERFSSFLRTVVKPFLEKQFQPTYYFQ